MVTPKLFTVHVDKPVCGHNVSFMRRTVTYKELYEMLTFLVAIATSVVLYAWLITATVL